MVRDHEHLTGKYRGGAHERCNLMLRMTYKVPVLFHNFRVYDSHLIVWGLRSFTGVDINLIGQEMEKYLTHGWAEHLVFKDSLQFLASSVDTLASNLVRSGKDVFKQLGAFLKVNGTAQPHFEMVLGKGVFPYEHREAWEKMNEHGLPARDAFSHTSTMSRAAVPTMPEQPKYGRPPTAPHHQYLEMYLKTDRLLLTDILGEFRGVWMRTHDLDPSHYVSS